MEEPKHREFVETWSQAPGVRGWFMEVNNQPLGKRFMVTALVFFAIGGVLALLMRLQLSVGDAELIGPERFNQLFTMHGSTMMYLFAVPFLEGLAVYVLPMLIGSRDAAFPRLTAFSYWTYLFGGILFYSSFFVGAVPDAGWFAYTPLSGPKYSGLGVDFWLLGLSLVEVAGIAAAVDVVATILKLRAPGMTISRMPLLVWTLLVSAVMILFAFTVLLTATMLLELDRAAGTKFFDLSAGGNSLLWQHLFWFFGHPEVYIMFLPATGIVSMVVAACARRKVAAYPLVVAAIVLIGFVSFGLWVHHMFTTGLPELAMGFFTAASLMIGVASGIQIFSWIATLWGTSPKWNAPFLWIAGFLVVFVLGGLTGVMVAVVPFDIQVHDTYFVVAHFHYVLIGGVVFPIFGALHYWFPKITGRMLAGGLAGWSFWLTFVGFNVAFFPMHLMGLMGLPRRVYTYPSSLGLDGMNIGASIGAFVMGAGFLVFLVNVAKSLRGGEKAGPDPWKGETLEWSLSSPPPPYLFLQPPVVHSRAPMWKDEGSVDEKTRKVVEAMKAAPRSWRATLSTDPLTATPQAIQYLPGPSLIPLLAALGVLVAMFGVLTKLYLLAPLGGIFLLGCLLHWLCPKKELLDRIKQDETISRTGLELFPIGARSTVWWGMLGTLTILGMMVGTLVFCYFYLRLFSAEWPQENLALPNVGLATLAFGLAVAGGLLAWTGWVRMLKGDRNATIGCLSLAFLAGFGFLIAFSFELAGLPFGPRINAYGSIFHVMGWLMLGLVVVHVCMSVVSAIRLFLLKEQESGWCRINVQLTGMFGVLTAGAAAVIFMTLYLSPRLL